VRSRCADLGVPFLANPFVFSLDPDGGRPLLPHSVSQLFEASAWVTLSSPKAGAAGSNPAGGTTPKVTFALEDCRDRLPGFGHDPQRTSTEVWIERAAYYLSSSRSSRDEGRFRHRLRSM
ncbi:MAG TPA: hypothetical protein VI357_00630, partial [Mycobacteriales bacterium]